MVILPLYSPLIIISNKSNHPEQEPELSSHERAIAADEAGMEPKKLAAIKDRRRFFKNAALGSAAIGLTVAGMSTEAKAQSTSVDDLLSPETKENQEKIDAMEKEFEKEIVKQEKAEVAEDTRLAEADDKREYARKDASVDGFWAASKEAMLPPTVVPALTKGLKAAIVYGKYRRQLAEAKGDIEDMDGTGTATIGEVTDNKDDHVDKLEEFYNTILGGKKEITTSIVLAAMLELWRFSSIIRNDEMVTGDKVSSGIGSVVGVGMLSALLYGGKRMGKTGNISKSMQCNFILGRFISQFDKAAKDLEKEINRRSTP